MLVKSAVDKERKEYIMKLQLMLVYVIAAPEPQLMLVCVIAAPEPQLMGGVHFKEIPGQPRKKE